MHKRRSAATENRIRLYWAFFRIFLAFASSSFFLYFLVLQVQNYQEKDNISSAVDLGVGVTQWIDLSIDEEQYTVSLMSNITLPIPLFSARGNYTYEYLKTLQEKSFVTLNMVITDFDEAGYVISDRPALLRNTKILQDMHKEVQLNPYEWNETIFYNYTTALHNARLALLDIISKNVNYLDNTITQQSIVLQTIFYYIENVGMMRDSVVMLKQNNNRDWLFDRDNVVAYNQGMAIYARAMSQRISGSLWYMYFNIIHSYDWQKCSKTITKTIHDSVYSNFTFDHEDWLNCTTTIIYQLRPITNEIKIILLSAGSKFKESYLSSLIISVIGLCLELVAAGTLIQQAIPVIILYSRFSSVLHAASTRSRTGTESSIKSNKKSDISL